MWNNPTNKQQQRGAVTLITALVVLVMLSLLALVGSRVALVQQRVTTNNAEAVTATATAAGALQAGVAYLNADQIPLAPSDWNKCSGSSAAPCDSVEQADNGTPNQSGDDWWYIGPFTNQSNLNSGTSVLPDLGTGSYDYKVWYLSNMIGRKPADTALTSKCTQLFGTDAIIPLFGTLGAITDGLKNIVNGVLGGLGNLVSPVLGLLGLNGLLPVKQLRLPDQLCLPVNFQQIGMIPPPSRINPTIHVYAAVVDEDSTKVVRRASTTVQPTSLFSHIPVASIMASDNIDLVGDVRVWGNPRPPTKPPQDFSTLSLDDLSPVGLPIGDILNGIVDPLAKNVLTPVLSPILDPVLHDLLGTTTQGLLTLELNVTFPLSIWSGGDVALQARVGMGNTGGSTTGGLAGLVKGLLTGLGNFLGNLLGLGTGNKIPTNLVLHSARTCLPAHPSSDKCTPLSQTVTVLQGTVEQDCTLGGILGCKVKKGSFELAETTIAANIRLPDIRDDSDPLLSSDPGDKFNELFVNTSGLLSFATNLLKGCAGEQGCGPDFPDNLFDYTFQVPKATLKNNADPVNIGNSGCGNLGSGITLIESGCTSIGGTVGSADAPALLLIEGSSITLEPGTVINGVVYVMSDNTPVIKTTFCENQSGSNCKRATIKGALVVDADDTTATVKGPINIIYKQDTIRKVGFMAGGFVPIPGSWIDTWGTL